MRPVILLKYLGAAGKESLALMYGGLSNKRWGALVYATGRQDYICDSARYGSKDYMWASPFAVRITAMCIVQRAAAARSGHIARSHADRAERGWTRYVSEEEREGVRPAELKNLARSLTLDHLVTGVAAYANIA